MANIQLSWELEERALLVGLDRIENRLNQIENELGQVQRASDQAFGRTGRQTRQFDKNVRSTQKTIGGTSKLMSRLGIASKVALGALATGSAIAATRAINLSKSYEQTRISFTTFLGSAALANEVLAELNQFSLATPFEPRQVQEAGKALLAFGIEVDNLSPSLRAIGDISAATGKDFNELAIIYGKARTQGTLFAEDINQLTEAGVPIIAEFAKQFGVTEGQVKKLGSEGKIQFANLEQAFRDLTSEGGQFFNLMAEQSQSLGGLLSTLQGSFDNLLRELGDEFLPVLKPLVREIIDFLDSLDPEAIILFFRPIKEDLIPALQDLYGNFIDLAQSLTGAKNEAELGEIVFNRIEESFNNIVTTLTIFSELSSFVVTSIKNIADAVKNALPDFEFLADSNEFVANAFEKLNNIDFKLLFDNFSVLQRYYLGLGFDAEEFANNVDKASERQIKSSEDYQKALDQQLEFDQKLREEAEKQEAEEARRRLAEKQAAKEREAEAKRAEAAAAKLREEYKKLQEQFEELTKAAREESLTGLDRLIYDRDAAIAEVKKFRDEFIAAAAASGQELPADFYDNLGLLFGQIKSEFIKELDKLAEDGEITQAQRRAALGYLPQATPEIVDDLNQRNQEQIQSIADNISAELKRAEDQAQKEGFNFREFVQRTFNLSDEELAGVERNFGQLIDSTIQALDFGTQLQITQQDQLISKLDERIQKQQELIDKEAQLAEEGYANNLDAEKANLDALNKERQRAAERRNEIERNAANRTLAIDAATQASRLTSTAIELFAGQARFGLPGILFAASALATLFSLIARARAQAQQFAQPVELRGGGLFDGPNLLSHESQRRSGKHHRIEGSNMAIEKGEWIIGTKHSKEHGSFLEALNAGKYSGIDLQESLAIAQTLNKRGRKVRAGADSVAVQSIIKRASGYDALQKEMRSVRESVEAVQAEVRRRPVVIPAGKAQVVTDDGIRREVKLIEVK